MSHEHVGSSNVSVKIYWAALYVSIDGKRENSKTNLLYSNYVTIPQAERKIQTSGKIVSLLSALVLCHNKHNPFIITHLLQSV